MSDMLTTNADFINIFSLMKQSSPPWGKETPYSSDAETNPKWGVGSREGGGEPPSYVFEKFSRPGPQLRLQDSAPKIFRRISRSNSVAIVRTFHNKHYGIHSRLMSKQPGPKSIIEIARAKRTGVFETEAWKSMQVAKARPPKVKAGDTKFPITTQQFKFARLIGRGESVMTAGVLAGYKQPHLCYVMMKMPKIAALVEHERKLYEQENAVTRQKVQAIFMEAIDMARLMSDPMSMIAGAREIGRMAGYYAAVEQKFTLTVDGELQLKQLNTMTDQQLMERIAMAAQQSGAQFVERVEEVK